MKLEGRVARVCQLYDERGQAFFPVIHKDTVIGGVADLDVGVTLIEMDLTSCLTVEHRGDLRIKAFNNIVYTFCIDLNRVDLEPFAINKDIILARDVPDMIGKTEFSAVGDGMESVRIWLENNYLKAYITPRVERDHIDYKCSVVKIIGSGTIIR